MPRIETDYTARITELPKLSQQSFVDTRGAQVLAQGVDQVGQFSRQQMQNEIELRTTEKQLSQARLLAEGKQQWMLDMDRRIADAEETGNYKDVLDSFDKEYSSWANNIIGQQVDDTDREKMRVSLIELQTPFLGQASNYIAKKRGEKIKENYDAALIPLLVQTRMAKNKTELQAAQDQAGPILDLLPTVELKKEAKEKLGVAGLQQYMSMAETPAEIQDAVDRISKVTGDFGKADQLAQFANSSNDRIMQSINKNVNSAIDDGMMLAKTGSLNDGWDYDARLDIESLDAKSRAEYQAKLDDVNTINIVTKQLWDMTPQQVNETVAELQLQMQNASAEDQKRIGSTLALYNKVLVDRYDMLTKDFVGVAATKSPGVKEWMDRYSEAVTNEDPVAAKSAFTNFVNSIDGYAKRIGWDGPVNYLSNAEVDRVALDLSTAFSRENGAQDVIQKFESYKQNYGDKFGAVIGQLAQKDPSLGPLAILNNLQSGTEKLDLVKALTIAKTNPDTYSDITRSTHSSVFTQPEKSKNLISDGRFSEDPIRREAFTALAKMYTKQGRSDAVERATKMAYGDFEVFGRVLYPTEKQPVIREIYTGAKTSLGSEDEFVPPISAQDNELKQIMSDPASYIDFVTSDDNRGLQAVWINRDNTSSEPVRRKSDGSKVVYTWNEAELSYINKYKTPEAIKQKKKSTFTIPMGGQF